MRDGSADTPLPTISVEDFFRADVRVGRVLEARPLERARKPAYRLRIDFGPTLGERTSSAQLVARYQTEDLIGSLVLAVVNFPPRQVATVVSQVLVLGVPDEEGHVVLVRPDADVPLGGRLF